MKEIIEQIKLKADSIPTNTKENRRVKGAYVDCLMMVKEASKNLVLADVSKSLMVDVLKRYEQWEANLIMEDSCWEGSMPTLTPELYEDLLEIQKLRNKALSNVC
jgi:hypothetical protein